MKILFAAGIFYPDVGGPAIHVLKIAEAMQANGFDVTVVAYGDDKTNRQFPFKVILVSRRLPKVLQWLYYYLIIKYKAITSKAIYAFDPTAAGLPACLASIIFRKPFIIRIGGDPIWERTVEMGKRFITIDDYYKQGLYIVDKPILYKLIRFIIKKADRVIVYGQFFKDFYVNYYDANPNKIIIVKNPVVRKEKSSPQIQDTPTLLFAGRFVSYKNLELVIEVFSNVVKKIGKGRFVLVGNGPDKNKLVDLVERLGINEIVIFKDSVPQSELFDYIRSATMCIGPALSEFNPNFILESLSLGKPVLLTKGNGLSVTLPEEFLFDPFDKKELENKMLNMFDKNCYPNMVEIVDSLPLNQSWDVVTDTHISIVKDVIIGKKL